MDKTIEELTHETLLQNKDTVRLGRHTYNIAPPSVATLIAASAAISRLPKMNLSNKEDEIVIDVMRNARNAKKVGLVLATMIIGVKRAGFPISSLIRKMRTRRCSRILLENLSSTEVLKLTYKLFGRMETKSFFGLIAFLSEVNATKATTTTTASGQPSEVS